MKPERWREIEDLYNAARECDPAGRAALLECTDPEIRSRVERMLALHSSGQVLDRPAVLFELATESVLGAGTQLGPYEVETLIGAGGMGAVYRAVDTRLGRVVALKISAARYSERFQLEAQAIATLNHPHVCTLYDVGPDYLVMEFIEGSTLAAEIRKGPLPLGLVARYEAQIAGALAEAHSRGIVHRDLKPANVMLTRHGVKVLDFGLAKVLSESGLTTTDAVMGTPAYMAPEQVEGREPTAGTDLFALGLMLYEMSVGRLPFPGASLGQMLSSGSHVAVAAPSQERSGVPSSLDGLIAKLLEKDPARRPRSAAEVAGELSALAGRIATQRFAGLRSVFRTVYAIPAIVLLLLLAAGGFWLSRHSARQTAPSLPVSGEPSSYTQITSFTDSAAGPALSPDGRMVAFFRSNNPFGTTDDIWIKLLPNGEPVRVTHDPRPKYGLAFSPDGGRIAYTVIDNDWRTYTVSSLGGTPQLFLMNAAGLSWLDDRHVLFSQIKTGIHMGIVTGTVDRSELREIYFPEHERGMAHYSLPSPDRKWVLVVEMDPEWHPCRLVPFSGASAGRQVGPAGACTSAAWSPDGQWMYFGAEVSGRNHLWRQRFPDGKPEQITFGSTEEGGLAVAPDGRSVITSVFTQQNAVWIHDSRGDRALSTEGYADWARPQFSLNGKTVYYLLRRLSPDSPSELWRADPASGRSEVVLPDVSIRDYDVSSDQKEVVFSTHLTGQASQLWLAPLNRSAPPRRIVASGAAEPHFGSNGQILFRLTDGNANYLGAVGLDGAGLRKASPDPIFDLDGVSPDGRFATVGATHGGSQSSQDVATFAIPLDGGPWQRVCEGYCVPTWAPDGRYFYIQAVSSLHAHPNGSTIAIPLPRGASLPDLPEEVMLRPAELVKVRGTRIVEHNLIASGPDPSTYAYIKPSGHDNLFRIPLP